MILLLISFILKVTKAFEESWCREQFELMPIKGDYITMELLLE